MSTLFENAVESGTVSSVDSGVVVDVLGSGAVAAAIVTTLSRCRTSVTGSASLGVATRVTVSTTLKTAPSVGAYCSSTDCACSVSSVAVSARGRESNCLKDLCFMSRFT